jgi:hypothetical protein
VTNAASAVSGYDVHLRAPRGTGSVDAADAPDDLSGLEGDILTAETIGQGGAGGAGIGNSQGMKLKSPTASSSSRRSNRTIGSAIRQDPYARVPGSSGSVA